MNAILTDLIVKLVTVLSRDHSQLEKLKEAVSILRSELDCKLKVPPCCFYVIVFVQRIVVHVKSGTFAPYLSTFRDLIQASDEGLIGLLEVFLGIASCML